MVHSMSLLHAKVFVLILSFGCALFGVMAAKWVEAYKKLLSYGQALAAGVLLSAGLVHMLPSACKQLCVGGSFPCANAVAGATFALLILIEELAVSLASSGSPDEVFSNASGDNCQGCQPRTSSSSDIVSPRRQRSGSLRSSNSIVNLVRKPSVGNRLEQAARGVVKAMGGQRQSSTPKGPRASGSRFEQCADCDFNSPLGAPLLASPICADPTCEESGEKATMGTNIQIDDGHGHGPDAGHGGIAMAGNMSDTKALMLFAALGFHSVMEGMGLGVSQSNKQVLGLALAILAHKALAAFALGSSLRQSSSITSRRFSALAFIFAAGTPLGGLIGVLISTVAEGWVVGICIAGCAGTFLQVASMELIPTALHSNFGSKLGRVFTMMLGYTGFAILAIWC